jgi:hypothetical protein
MRALDVEAAGAVVTAILDDCRRRGDYSTILVPPRDRNVGLWVFASLIITSLIIRQGKPCIRCWTWSRT